MKMFKDRRVQIGAAVVVILLLVTGFLLFAPKAEKQDDESLVETNKVIKLSADELGLKLEAKSDGKAVKFIIEKAEGIESIEYSLSYEADSTASERSEGGLDRVQRGIIGEADVKGGASFESEWLDLGSCSKNVCRYDSGVELVELDLKIEKADGKTYSAESNLEL